MSNVPKPNPNRNYPYLSIEKVSLNEYIRSMKQYGHTEFLDYDKIAEPERKTKYSAGYDFVTPITISLRPNEKIVVPLGYKVKCEATGIYFGLFLRSSIASNYGIMMMNNVGIIDADYYNNPDNEGHIYFQVINLTTFDIQLKKGDKIGQGIIKPYLTTDDDNAFGQRLGGFGSTTSSPEANQASLT